MEGKPPNLRLLLLVAWLGLVLPGSLCAQEFTYVTNEGGTSITITGYTGLGGEVVIPDIIDGFQVSEIGYAAFYASENLASIVIPDTVLRIDDSVFSGCQSLTNVLLGHNLTHIGGEAFRHCSSLTNITIPNTVTFIGTRAFNNCSSLSEIAIPNSVTHVGVEVFSWCFALTNVSIGTGLTNIEGWMFSRCTNLANITLPNNITGIRDYGFADSGLTNITIPDSVGIIRYGAFQGCDKLRSVSIGNGVTDTTAYVFSGCKSLSSVTLGSNLVSIEYTTFLACTSLTNITIPKNLTGFGYRAFHGCTNLTRVYCLGNAPSIGNYAFLGVDKATFYYSPGTSGWEPTFAGLPTEPFPFTYITSNDAVTITGGIGSVRVAAIPETVMGFPVTSIAPGAFSNWTTLSGITIAASVADIGDLAFESCTGLNSVFFEGNAPTNIDSGISSGSDHVTVYRMPGTSGWGSTFAERPVEPFPFNYITYNGSNTITGYLGTEAAVTIPKTIGGLRVVAINDFAIQSPDLTQITIPHTITSIGGGAFSYCPSLTSITVDPFNYDYTSADGILFDKAITTIVQYPPAKPGPYTVPDSVASIAGYGFLSCDGLTSITFHRSMASLGSYSFYDCDNLTGAYFWGNAPNLGDAVFQNSPSATVYYLPGTVGWGPTYGGAPAAHWYLPQPLILTLPPNFGVQSDQYGFVVSWATNGSLVVEGSADLATATWLPLQTNSLVDGWFYFTDPDWTIHPARFYRIRSP